jgi:probable phosphoglycerate mutase
MNKITKVILVRHGQSLGKLTRCFIGHGYAPLTELGHEQAEKSAVFLDKYPIDAIYSSDLMRACQTAEHTAKRHGLEIIKDSGLREIFAGEWEGKKFDTLDTEYAENYEIWKRDIGNAHPDGGESVAELYRRVVSTLCEIAEINAGKTVCIATHATPIRAVCAAAEGYEACDMAKIPWTANASISLFEYENGKFKAVYTGNADHLGDLKTVFPSNV